MRKREGSKGRERKRRRKNVKEGKLGELRKRGKKQRREGGNSGGKNYFRRILEGF